MLELTTTNEASALVKGMAHWTWKDGFFHFSAETGVNPNTFNAGIKGGDAHRRQPGPRQSLCTAPGAVSVIWRANDKVRIRVGSSSGDYSGATVNALRHAVHRTQVFASGDYLGVLGAPLPSNPHEAAGK